MRPLAFATILLIGINGAKAQIRSPPLIEFLFNITINIDPEAIGPLTVPGGLQTGTPAFLPLAPTFHSEQLRLFRF